MSEPANGPAGVPGAGRPAENDLDTLDQLVTADQVPVYDRMHSTLAEALARTADNGAPPLPGESGA
jgi:hypothetical protein